MLNLRGAKNSKEQGNIGLATAIWWFETHGYRVFVPLTDSQDEDLVVKMADRFYSVQVKTTYFKTEHNLYKVNLVVSGGNRSGSGKVKLFDPSKVDYVFVVTEDREMYLIPTGAIETSRSINLGKKYAEYQVT
jgi:hypothetical protein